MCVCMCADDWLCMRHRCDTCGEAANAMCVFCPASYCDQHADGNIKTCAFSHRPGCRIRHRVCTAHKNMTYNMAEDRRPHLSKSKVRRIIVATVVGRILGQAKLRAVKFWLFHGNCVCVYWCYTVHHCLHFLHIKSMYWADCASHSDSSSDWFSVCLWRKLVTTLIRSTIFCGWQNFRSSQAAELLVMPQKLSELWNFGCSTEIFQYLEIRLITLWVLTSAKVNIN